jgi:hypothetical protein
MVYAVWNKGEHLQGKWQTQAIQFCCDLVVKFEDDVAAWCNILNEEATFHLCVHVSHHNIHFWDQENHQALLRLNNNQCVVSYFIRKGSFFIRQ